MRMLKTFFRDVTTQSKTACGGKIDKWADEARCSLSEICEATPKPKNKLTKKKKKTLESVTDRTLSLGSLLMVFRGRRTLRTRRDFIVLMSRPLLFLLTLKRGT